MTDTITILAAEPGKRASKTWLADGTTADYDAGWRFKIYQQPVANLDDLSAFLTSIQNMPEYMAIRGQYLGDEHASNITRLDTDPRRPGVMLPAIVGGGWYRRWGEMFNDTPHHWMCVDIDNYIPPPSIDPVADPTRTIAAFIGAHLPSEFYGAGYHWQLSSSAGHPTKRGLLKAHVWFWLETPHTSVELEAWAPLGVDRSLYRVNHVHYTANPIFAPGVVDPVPVRCGCVAGGVVSLVLTEAQRTAAAAPRTGRDMIDPRTKTGVVGAFCRAYSIEQVLAGPLADQFSFDRGSDRRLTWHKGNGALSGARITDDGLHLFNSHATSPVGTTPLNAFDAVRVYCFGHHDRAPGVHPMVLNEMRTRPSYLAMVDYAMRLASVVAEMQAGAENTAQAVSGGGRPAFGFIRARDLLTKPKPIPQLIHDLFEQGALAQLFGKSGSAKSFLAIDWACCVATGKEWCGRKVAQGAVFYIAGEGHAGIRKRLKVWEQHHATPLADAPLFVSNAPAALMDVTNAANVAREVEVLATEHGAPVLIIVDTLARNLGAGEENSNADIGLFINNLDTLLRTRFGATVLIVHHTGHGEQERSRGASSLRAAMDHEYRLEDKGGIRELSCTKAKESEPPPLMRFRLLPVTLSGWTNENGEFITSAVLVPTTDKPVANLLELTGANLVAHKALGNAIREFGVVPDPGTFVGCANQPPGKVVSEEIWRQRAYDEGISDGEQDAKKKAFGRSRQALLDKNLIATWKNFYWPVSMPGHGTLPGHSGTLSRAQGDRPGHTSIDVSRCPAPVA